MTDCTPTQLEFEGLGRRHVTADFSAERATTDGGLLLLREVEARRAILKRFADCFDDGRNPDLIEHSLQALLAQRVYGICCGYEDLNDHDSMRDDILLAAAAGSEDPAGQARKRKRDHGHGLAGKSTLNRLELAQEPGAEKRYKKITMLPEKIENLFIEIFLDAHQKPPKSIVLDLDATDDPLYGNQEGRFFHGYYGCYCYLPLYITCGNFLLCAKLRPSNIDAAAGSLEEVSRIVSQIRKRWPKTEIILRADSGFCRDDLMFWCERNRVHFLFGLAKNERLIDEIAPELAAARSVCKKTGKPARRFRDFFYRTLASWSRKRRVVGKAEALPGKTNPRFVVTSLPRRRFAAQFLYEKIYCARGDMENRIKEQQLALFADRTSTRNLRANQLRLWFSSISYILLNEFRRIGLAKTELARAQCGTIRTRLLKIGGVVRVSVRRLRVALNSAFPLREIFARALKNIQSASP